MDGIMGTSTERFYRDYQSKPEVQEYLKSSVTNPEILPMNYRLFDQLYAAAPEPPSHRIQSDMRIDVGMNPHNDNYQPYRRSEEQIKADYRFHYALVLLHKRNVAMGNDQSTINQWVK